MNTDVADESVRRRELHRERARQSEVRFGLLAEIEGDHQDRLARVDRARNLLDSLDDADGYRTRARRHLEAEHGDWAPRHLVDLTAGRLAWADGHRPPEEDQ